MKSVSVKEISTKNQKSKAELLAYINASCNELERSETKNQAFLPQKNMRERLAKEADFLYQKYKDTDKKPELYGVLIGVKDLYNVEGFETKGGSSLPAHLFEGKEASSVTKLKDAGALVLGKTVTTEFAYSDPGPTKNPHNLAHTPGGSSSGSAAAVAMGLVPLALGTQTIGSIIRPAAYCGVFGFKPSYNRIAKDGVIEFAGSVDHIGTFAQNLDDLQLSASLLCDNWNENKIRTSEKLQAGIPVGDYLALANEDITTRYIEVQDKLKSQSVDFKDINSLSDFTDIKKKHWDICAYELWQVHKNWYSEYKDLYRPLISALFEVGRNTPKTDVEIAVAGQLKLRQQIEDEMDTKNLDFIIAPSTRDFAPKGLESTGDSIMNLPWTYAGLPAINIPFGKNQDNLPFGFQIIGRYNQDEQLFEIAKHIVKILY